MLALRADVPKFHDQALAQLLLQVQVVAFRVGIAQLGVGRAGSQRGCRRAGVETTHRQRAALAHWVSIGRIPGQPGHDATHGFVGHDAVAAAQHRVVVSPQVINKTNARLVIVVLVIRLAHMHQAAGVRVKVDQPAAPFRRRTVPLVTKARFHLKPRRYFVIVRDKGAGRVLEDAAVDLRGRHGKSTGSPIDEVGRRAESDGAWVLCERVTDESAKFTAHLEGVFSPGPRKRVREYTRGVKTALGKSRGSSKVQPDVLHGDLRQRIVVGNTVLNAEVLGIFWCVRYKGDSDAVEAQASLVHDTGGENVDLVQRADLPVGGAMIAKAWNGVALQVGLGTSILLPGVA